MIFRHRLTYNLIHFFIVGYCCIQYRKCDTKRSFTLGNQVAAFNQAKHGADCTGDFITIEGNFLKESLLIEEKEYEIIKLFFIILSFKFLYFLINNSIVRNGNFHR